MSALVRVIDENDNEPMFSVNKLAVRIAPGGGKDGTPNGVVIRGDGGSKKSDIGSGIGRSGGGGGGGGGGDGGGGGGGGGGGDGGGGGGGGSGGGHGENSNGLNRNVTIVTTLADTRVQSELVSRCCCCFCYFN